MNREKIHLIVLPIIILTIGILLGYKIGHFQGLKASFPEIMPIQDTNPEVATVKLMEVKNGKLIGKISGQTTRLAYSPEHILELQPENNFEIPLEEVNLNLFYLENQIPENTHYIASSSGKYYYHVLDKRALSITPKNRKFFNSKEEAEKAGFLPKE